MVVWTHEYLAGAAFMPGYHRRLVESVRRFNAIIVSNPLMKGQLEGVNDNVHILPGGVDVGQFVYEQPAAKFRDERKVILMAENIRENASQLTRFKRAERTRTGAKQIKRGQEIPIAVLVKSVSLKRRLDLTGSVQRSLPRLASAIQKELAKP